MDTFLLTIGENEILKKEKFLISQVLHCLDQKNRPVSICNVKYIENEEEKYLLLEMPFLKVIKKEDNFIYLLIEDNIKKELNEIDDILLNLIDDVENRDDCKDAFENITTEEFIYNTVLKTNETYSYIKVFYNKSSNFLYKDKEIDISNVNIDDMVQVILLIESIRIYINDSCCIVKNMGHKFIIHKPVKQYKEPVINLKNLNTHYKEKECFKKQIIDDVSKTIMEEEYKNEDYKNEDTVNEDYKNEDCKNEDYKNEDYKNEDVVNEDYKNEDVVNEDCKNEDVVNEDVVKQVIKKRGRKPTKK
jgi:hypothetical protein